MRYAEVRKLGAGVEGWPLSVCWSNEGLAQFPKWGHWNERSNVTWTGKDANSQTHYARNSGAENRCVNQAPSDCDVCVRLRTYALSSEKVRLFPRTTRLTPAFYWGRGSCLLFIDLSLIYRLSSHSFICFSGKIHGKGSRSMFWSVVASWL